MQVPIFQMISVTFLLKAGHYPKGTVHRIMAFYSLPPSSLLVLALVGGLPSRSLPPARACDFITASSAAANVIATIERGALQSVTLDGERRGLDDGNGIGWPL